MESRKVFIMQDVVACFRVLCHIVSKITRYMIGYAHGGSCGRVLSLNTREMRTPTPSKTLSRIPQAMADPRADRGPPGNDMLVTANVYSSDR